MMFVRRNKGRDQCVDIQKVGQVKPPVAIQIPVVRSGSRLTGGVPFRVFESLGEGFEFPIRHPECAALIAPF